VLVIVTVQCTRQSPMSLPDCTPALQRVAPSCTMLYSVLHRAELRAASHTPFRAAISTAAHWPTPLHAQGHSRLSRPPHEARTAQCCIRASPRRSAAGRGLCNDVL